MGTCTLPVIGLTLVVIILANLMLFSPVWLSYHRKYNWEKRRYNGGVAPSGKAWVTESIDTSVDFGSSYIVLNDPGNPGKKLVVTNSYLDYPRFLRDYLSRLSRENRQ